MDMLFRQVWAGGAKENENLARQCVADILASTDASGYLGVHESKHRFNSSYVTPFGMACVNQTGGMGAIFDAFLTYYRLTEEEKRFFWSPTVSRCSV